MDDGYQVAAMVVISIANTTVHGVGGLGIPTVCLVSQESDWRWIDPRLAVTGIHRWMPLPRLKRQLKPAYDAENWLQSFDTFTCCLILTLHISLLVNP